ncbi:MAG TPA: hypothetical protein VK190_04820 [Pseudoneobacillus sp.]|nr:hypothetical protein [Pseudoneobacillus sp.]
MNAQEVKEILNTEDIIDLLVELGADPMRKGNTVLCNTICHGGQRKKLVYYTDTKTFTCFTDSCGHGFDVFILVGRVLGMDFASAFRYITTKFRINTETTYLLGEDRVDTTFIKKFKKREPQYTLSEIDKGLLNSFYQLYHESWLNDGISIESMKKFGVLFSIMENKIIIPHFDVDYRLLGIRGRSLNQEEIDAGKKYMPIYHKGEVRKHPTGGNIYGLHVTKEQIRKHRTTILFESEKGPMQLDTMLPDMSIGGGISGSALSFEQVKILQDLGVEHVCLGLDKEFEENGSQDELFYKQKVKSGFIDKLLPYFHVSIMWDTQKLLNLKDAPTDHGLEVFINLWNNKIHI